MEVYIIQKNNVSHDCWGCYESNWEDTNLIFINEEDAIKYINVDCFHSKGLYSYRKVKIKC